MPTLSLASPPLRVLALPLRLLPLGMHSRALAITLDAVLSQSLASGDLDFLAGRCLAIEVTDLGLGYRLGLAEGRIAGLGEAARPEATIAGNLKDLLLLATRREDADTLFFARRLRMGGDTELGLHLKNFLDAFEPPAAWTPLFRGLERLADLAIRAR